MLLTLESYKVYIHLGVNGTPWLRHAIYLKLRQKLFAPLLRSACIFSKISFSFANSNGDLAYMLRAGPNSLSSYGMK